MSSATGQRLYTTRECVLREGRVPLPLLESGSGTWWNSILIFLISGNMRGKNSTVPVLNPLTGRLLVDPADFSKLTFRRPRRVWVWTWKSRAAEPSGPLTALAAAVLSLKAAAADLLSGYRPPKSASQDSSRDLHDRGITVNKNTIYCSTQNSTELTEIQFSEWGLMFLSGENIPGRVANARVWPYATSQTLPTPPGKSSVSEWPPGQSRQKRLQNSSPTLKHRAEQLPSDFSASGDNPHVNNEANTVLHSLTRWW